MLSPAFITLAADAIKSAPVCRIKRSRHLDLALFASKAAALIKFQKQTVFAVADTRRALNVQAK
jgi:hypothetical protein